MVGSPPYGRVRGYNERGNGRFGRACREKIAASPDMAEVSLLFRYVCTAGKMT
jgi:hypothetical protein